MMRQGRINMICPWCMKRLEVDRDDTDPPEAVLISLVCDTCHDGDFHTPEFYDSTDQWVHPTEHMA